MAFSSWRLSSSIAQSQGSMSLPAPAAPAQASDTDYVTARHAALLNALVQQPQGCYTFLEEGPGSPNDEGRLGLYQLDLGEPHRLPTLSRVCGAWAGAGRGGGQAAPPAASGICLVVP